MIPIVSDQYSGELGEALGISTVLTKRAAPYDDASDQFWPLNRRLPGCTSLYCGVILWDKKRLPTELGGDLVTSAYRTLSPTAAQVVRNTSTGDPRTTTQPDDRHSATTNTND